MMLFISHRPVEPYSDPWVLPVGVGGLELAGGISDRTVGLDRVNGQLCEWTGILTAAAMMRSGALVTDSPWIGTCHYRRLLWLTSIRHGSNQARFYRRTDHPMRSCRALIEPAHVGEVLKEFDCIVPRPHFYDLPLSDQYCTVHRAADWEALLDAVREVLGTDARRYFDRGHTFTPYCMLVLPTQRFLELCDDALAIIERLLARIVPVEDKYQNRAIGFLMERFVTFYLHHRRLRAFETPVVLIDPDAK